MKSKNTPLTPPLLTNGSENGRGWGEKGRKMISAFREREREPAVVVASWQQDLYLAPASPSLHIGKSMK